MSRTRNPHERRGGPASLLIDLATALAVITLLTSVIALAGMGLVLGAVWLADQSNESMSEVMRHLGGSALQAHLPVMWGHLAVPVYACASVAALSVVTLCTVRHPKPTRHTTPMEGTA